MKTISDVQQLGTLNKADFVVSRKGIVHKPDCPHFKGIFSGKVHLFCYTPEEKKQVKHLKKCSDCNPDF